MASVDGGDALRRLRTLERLVDHVPAMLGYWDRDLLNVVANRAYVGWFGKSPDEIRGRHIRDLLGEELFALNHPHMLRALAGEEQHFDRTIPAPDGELRYSQADYIPDVDESGVVHGFFVLVADVTARVLAEQELRAAKEELERRADTDLLTGVASRRMLEERIALALQGLRRAHGERLVGVLMLDLDGFKPINDRYGHATGDEVLVEVAARLSAGVRKPDLVARIGGDEFVVLLPGLASEEQATHIAERLVEAVGRPIAPPSLAGVQVRVSTSLGVAITTGEGEPSVRDLLGEADQLMYVAKRAGGDRWALRPPGARVPAPRVSAAAAPAAERRSRDRGA